MQSSISTAAPPTDPPVHLLSSLYAAHVWLSQAGKAGIMVLANLLLLYATLLVLGLQKLLYDAPTPTHIDEVFGIFTLTIIETTLAALIARQDVNVGFLLTFILFLVGKWWALFGEAQTKRQEGYPSRVSFLMYARFGTATLLSIAFDVCMAVYTARDPGQSTLRPAMAALFAFEFAILAISSLSTAARLAFCAIATADIRKRTILSQQQSRGELALLDNRRRAMAARASSWEQDEANSYLPVPAGDHAGERTVRFSHDERWGTRIGMATDLLKLLTYLYYFAIYRSSHGIPVELIHEPFLILKARIAQARNFLRWEKTMRQITEHLTNPTGKEIAECAVCMICFGKMDRQDQSQSAKVVSHTSTNSADAISRWQDLGRPNTSGTSSEERPKRLACGHILHFVCLKRWIERQRTCPICRQPL